MEKSKAIVTMIVGEKYIYLWNKYCKKNWEAYAKKNGYELVCFTELLDTSDRALKRSPSWQRCIIFNDKRLQKYEQVVWIDSDIIINEEEAPDIVSKVPVEKIGGTNSYSMYNKAIYDSLYVKKLEYWKENNIKAVVNPTPEVFYELWGLSGDVKEVIHCGVLVLSPLYHKDILEYVYYNYEDKGGAEWNYEMRPLSYEIVKANLHHFIDDRFNLGYTNYLMLNYPFLFNREWNSNISHRLFNKSIAILAKTLNIKLNSVEVLAAESAYQNSFFLHFAGCGNDVKVITRSIAEIKKQKISKGVVVL